MDSGSDSSFVDDELIIGEVDRTEYTKKLLMRAPSIPSASRRNTFSGMPSQDEEISEYFTPDSTISKTNFLDKMREVLDGPPTVNETYKTAYDTTIDRSIKSRRSSLPKLPPATLINEMETISLSENYQQPPEIEISENELDDDFLRYQGTQIKYENITDVDIDCSSDDETNDTTGTGHNSGYLNHKTRSNQIAQYSLLNFQYSEYSDCSFRKMEAISHFGLLNPQYTECSTEESEHVSLASSQCTQCSDDYYSENDTPFKPPLKTPIKPKKKGGGIPKLVKPSSNTDSTGSNILKPRNDDLCKKLASPKVSDKFKHVQSPIGFYIKNSSTAPVVRNAKAAHKLAAILPESYFGDIPDEPFIDFDIPDIIYKPSTVQYMTKEEEINLPKNIQALVPAFSDMFVTKTEKRINGRDIAPEYIRRRLEEDLDLTRNRSIHIENPDISVIRINPYA